MLTGVTAQSVAFAREHLDTIRDAGPYRLDDATVARMLRMWNDTSDMNQLFAEQGQRWRQEAKGTRQEGDVVHFCALVDEERGLIDEILAIAQLLQTVTIERLPRQILTHCRSASRITGTVIALSAFWSPRRG